MAMEPRRHHGDPRMSQIVVDGTTVYLSGQVALSRRGASVTEQTEAILDQIDTLLAEAGSDKTRLLSAMIILTDLATFDEMNRLWSAWLPPEKAPVRTTFGAALALPGLSVEITIIATTNGGTE